MGGGSGLAAARAEMEVVAAEAAQQMVAQLTGLKVDERDASKAIEAELAGMSGVGQESRAEPVQHEAAGAE